MSPRYATARSQTTPGGFGLEVAKAGYATASAEAYSTGIANFAQSQGSLINSMSTQLAAAQRTGGGPTNVTIIATTPGSTQNNGAAAPPQPRTERPAVLAS
jgi:hypothetical protein